MLSATVYIKSALKSFKKLMFFFVFFWAFSAFGDTHTSNVAVGNFNVGGTWDVGAIPANGDVVIIQTGHRITMPVNDRIRTLIIQPGGELVINAGRTLRVDTDVQLHYGNGQNGAIVSGAGTIRIRNGGNFKDIIYDGAAYVSPVTISVANVRLDADISFDVADDGVAGNVDLLISSVVHDNGNDRKLIKRGNGSMTLSGANTYTDNFRFFGGRLNINHAQALGLGGAANRIEINGGTHIDNTSGAAITDASGLQVRVQNSFEFTGTNDLTFNTNAVNWRGDYTLTCATVNRNLTFNGVISDQGNNDEIIKAGPGTLTLGGANTYEQIILNAGQLNINHAQALGNETGAPGAFEINGGIIDNTSGGAVTSVIAKRTFINADFTYEGSNDLSLGTGQVRLNGDWTVTCNGASTLTLDGSIADVGNNDMLIKAGAGRLSLTKNNTHDGTRLNAGILNLNHARAIGGENKSFADPALEINGGTIDNTSGAKVTFTRAYRVRWNSDWTFAGTNDIDFGVSQTRLFGDFTVTTTAGELTLSTTVSDDGNDDILIKDGAGTLTLSANNTHDGTRLNAGTLNLNHARAIGGENKTFADPALEINGGTIDNTSGGTITFTRAYRVRWNNSWTFTGTNNLDFGVAIQRLFGDHTVTCNGGELIFTSALSDDGNDDDLIKDGVGTLTLAANNTHQSTTLNDGTLNINHVRALGGETGADGAFKVNGGTIDNTSGGPITLTRAYRQTWNANFAWGGTHALDMSTGNVTLAANVGITCNGLSALVQDGIIGGAFRLSKLGAGVLTLQKANTFNGTTLTLGTLNLGNAQALGATGNTFIINGGTLDNTSGGALTLTASYPMTWNGDWTFLGSNDLNTSTGAVTMGANIQLTTTTAGRNLTIDGAIGGGFGLTKLGAGILTLEQASTFTGGVTLTAGQLNIADAAALGTTAGTFVINAGTTIDNTTGAGLTTSNYPMTWNGDFTFVGSSTLNMGNGAVTMGADVAITVTANTFRPRGTITGGQSLTKLGAGTLRFGNNDVTLNNLTNTAGTLRPPGGAGTMFIAGDFTNNATLNMPAGEMEFNGGAAQQIAGATNPTIFNFEKNGAGTLTINNETTISNTLTMTDGIVNAAHALNVADGATSNGGTATSYVTNFLKKFGTNDFIFPVGAGTQWRPIQVSNYTAGDATTVMTAKFYFSGHWANSQRDTSVVKLRKVSKVEYWDLNHDAGTAPTLNITLHWKDWTVSGTQVTGGSTDSLVVAHYNGFKWESFGTNNGITHAAVGSVTAANVSDFSPFTFGSLLRTEASTAFVPLPVELLDFNVEKTDEGSNVVTWTTASEVNSSYFVVQRSYDGVNFEDVYVMDAQGNSDDLSTYVFEDHDANSGNVYYRLKQVDEDESDAFSEIETVTEFEEKEGFRLSPNPISTYGVLTLFDLPVGEGGDVLIEIVDQNGSTVHMCSASSSTFQIALTQFGMDRGLYFVRVATKAETHMEKLIIQ